MEAAVLRMRPLLTHPTVKLPTPAGSPWVQHQGGTESWVL